MNASRHTSAYPTVGEYVDPRCLPVPHFGGVECGADRKLLLCLQCEHGSSSSIESGNIKSYFSRWF